MLTLYKSSLAEARDMIQVV